jgi:hypothetical protein
MTASFVSCQRKTTLSSRYSTSSGCGSPASGRSSRNARSAASCSPVIAMQTSVRQRVQHVGYRRNGHVNPA